VVQVLLSIGWLGVGGVGDWVTFGGVHAGHAGAKGRWARPVADSLLTWLAQGERLVGAGPEGTDAGHESAGSWSSGFSMRISTGVSGRVQGWSEEGEITGEWDQLGCHCGGG